MRLRDVALGDRDEAGQPRFGREQIVVRGVEAAGAFGVRRAVADRQQAALLVVEQAEVHAVGEHRRALREALETVRCDMDRPDRGVDVDPEPPRPVGDVRTSDLVRSGVEFRRNGFEVLSWPASFASFSSLLVAESTTMLRRLDTASFSGRRSARPTTFSPSAFVMAR